MGEARAPNVWSASDPFRLFELVYRMVTPCPNLSVVVARNHCQAVAELGKEIAAILTAIGCIGRRSQGAAIFLSDLARQIPLDATFDFYWSFELRKSSTVKKIRPVTRHGFAG